jgi:hypothetical protein
MGGGAGYSKHLSREITRSSAGTGSPRRFRSCGSSAPGRARTPAGTRSAPGAALRRSGSQLSPVGSRFRRPQKKGRTRVTELFLSPACGASLRSGCCGNARTGQPGHFGPAQGDARPLEPDLDSCPAHPRIVDVPQYWLKPLGVTEPYDPMDNDWTAGVDLERYEFATGPATQRQPPQIGRGDLVLFHAVIHVRLFAAAEITGNPRWRKDPVYDLRWPWVYPCRVTVWVPLLEDGPRTTEIAPKKAMGRIQFGADFADLTASEYRSLLDELLACPTVQTRDGSG